LILVDSNMSGPRSFGILTLATPNDYRKAIGLALSARVSNPGVPIAVACSPKIEPLVAPYFDAVIAERTDIRGFVHKVHLDEYSPYDVTFFLDSDVLLFKPLRPYVESWGELAYTACGIYLADGKSAFGMDRAAVLRKIGRDRLAVIDGAGHALFRKPDCQAVFDLARHITRHHDEYVGPIPYADEDVMDIAMTQLDLPPMPSADFFSRHLSALKGTLVMDATKGVCRFTAVDTGEQVAPCMMHFAANEAALTYHWQLYKLFRQYGVSASGLLSEAMHDFSEREIYLRAHILKKRLLGREG
jgi:hypothetical protein